MCTVILSSRQHPRWPLIVAANRDELTARPAQGLSVWPGTDVVAPKDLQAGGTWLGLNGRGHFVGVTNRFMAPRHPERRSRGALVVEALAEANAQALARAVERVDATTFNACHLLSADAQDVWSHAFIDDRRVSSRLGPGLHVVTERSYAEAPAPREALVREAWTALPLDGDGLPTVEGVRALLSLQRSGDPTANVCVELPEFGYGTRSSFLLFLGARPEDTRVYETEGRPDRTAFVERTALWRTLRG